MRERALALFERWGDGAIVVAFIALVACRVVYPTADRLDLAMAGERP